MIDSAIDIALNLSRYDASVRSDVNQQLLKLEKELRAKLQEPLTEWSRKRVEKLLMDCEDIIRSYYDDAAFTTSEATSGAGEVVAKATLDSFPAALSATLPTAQMLKSIVSDVMILGNPASAYWDKQSADTVFNFKAAVRQGLAQGETNQQIIRRVLPVLDMSRRNASSLVQTAVQSVASDARMVTYDANQDLISCYDFFNTLDSHTCVRCMSMYGARVDINFKPLNGKQYIKTPIHFSCRCGWVAVTKTFKELGIDMPEPATGTRASDQGQVSRKLTFDDFLKGKSQAYQDEMLGKGRADMFRNGKITLSDLTNGNANPLTLEQLRAKYH